MHLFTLAASVIAFATPAWSWGREGHQITAAIAQIHLLPSTKGAICNILPTASNCSLVRVATWPDDVKKLPEWSWSARLHFANGKGDHPPDNCAFGTNGWVDQANILYGIVNMTRNIKSQYDPDISLRFLTHFLGDIHQPLHLAGRDVGGNLVPVLYNKENTSLHFAWDDKFIDQRISTLTNYTQPLPTNPNSKLPPSILDRNQKIEAGLTGSNFDPLVRWIVTEGIYGWWGSQLEEWATCPQFELAEQGNQRVMALNNLPFEDPLDVPVCPFHWAASNHHMLCDFIWRPEFLGVKWEEWKHAEHKIELNTPEYGDRIRDEKIIEKQLALGGMRLAAVLNTLLGSHDEKGTLGVLPRLF